MKEFYEEFSMLRGIAILLVLLGHAILVYPVNLQTNYYWCKLLHDYIYSFHMPVFFIISGFLYANGGKSDRTYNSYMRSKFNRLMVPYVVMSFIDLAPRIFFSNLVNHKSNGYIYDLKNVLLNGGHYWFIYVLFIILLIFPVIESLYNYNKIKYLILPINILLAYYFSFIQYDIFLIHLVIYYLIFFTFGFCMFFVYSNEVKLIFSNNYVFLALILMFIFLGNQNFKNFWLVLIVQFIGSALFYSITIKIKNMRMKKILNLCSNFSLQLYLLNGFLLVISRVMVINIFSIANPFVIIFINFIFTLVVGLIISSKIINRFYVTKRIFGIL